MSVQTALPQPPVNLKRSGSINNLLRSKAGSLRRKDGHKRSASNQATMPLQMQNISLAGATDDAWQSRTSSDKGRPFFSYAVTITAGDKKPKEKRRMFERILHKRTPTKGLFAIEEDGSRTPKKSITPAIIRDEPMPVRRPSRGHSRSASALSFFQQDISKPIAEEDEDTIPLRRVFPAFHIRPSSSEESTPGGQSPVVSKYNATSPVQRKPIFSRKSSNESSSSEARSEDSKPERPKLKVISDPNEAVSHSMPNMLSVAHPPRKSSLPGTELVRPQTDSDTERPGSSKDALAKSFESASKHRRKRSAEMVEIVIPNPIAILDPIGPTPPPKDNDKGYHVHQLDQQLHQGVETTISDKSPPNIAAVFGEAGPRRNVFNNVKTAPKHSNTLPAPQLAQPRKSTLSSRRNAVPSSLKVAPKARRKDIRGVNGSVLSPIPRSNNRVMKSRGSSRSSSRVSSPSVNTAVPRDPKRMAIVPPVPARRAPPPPALAVKTTRSPPQPRPRTRTEPPQPITTLRPDLIIRAPIIAAADQAPTPPAKSPKRIGSMKRRSTSEGFIPIIDGTSYHRSRNSHRRKSIHRQRKPTGFRLTKEKESILRGRGTDRAAMPTLPSSLEQTAMSIVVGRRQKSESPVKGATGLTPPQVQGEWAADSKAKEQGRRQPSPLRSTEIAERRPDVGVRSTTNISDASNATSNSTASRGRQDSLSAAATSTSTLVSTSAALRPAALTLEQHQAQFESIRRNGTLNGRERSGSKTALQPGAAAPVTLGMTNPLAAHPTTAGPQMAATLPTVASSAEVKAVGKAKIVDAGTRVTPEESIKRMMEKQERQAVAMRMKLLGLGGKREGS